jgi:PAS domain S-box-containing protein
VDTESELLRTACERIDDLREPAFIKDGALNYVAVNAAYARLFGRPPETLVGTSSVGLAGGHEDPERREKECRSIVFGTEETARCFDRAGAVSHEVQIERFLSEDDRAFLFGVFRSLQPTAAEAPGGIVIAAAHGGIGSLDGDLLHDALDLLEMGIGIYDAENALVYSNAELVNYLGPGSMELKPGVNLSEILGAAYDRRRRQSPAGFGREFPDRDAWIAERLKRFDLPYSEDVKQLPDGRWMRSINKRHENGALIAIRHDVSDFKEQEMALRGALGEAELLRAALEDLPVAVFMRDSHQRLAFVNGAYEKMYGANREDILGKTEAEMFPERAAERSLEENDRLLADGELNEKTEEKSFSDGRVMPVITRQKRIVAGDGQPHIVGSITDISPVKEAMEKADKLRQDLQTVLHATPVGVAILDRDFTFEYANPAFYGFWDAGEQFELTGRSYRDFLKVNFDHGIYGDTQLTFEEIYQRRIAALSDCDERAPIEVRSRNGRVILISGTRLTGEKMLLTYMDITAARRRDEEVQEARAALERHGALMRDATSAMSQGLLILHDGEIVFSNDALAGMLHIPAEMTAPGASWREIFRVNAKRGDLGSPDEAVATLRSWEENVALGKPVSATFRIEGRRWLQVEANITASEHWLAIFTDITEMKEREADLTRLLHRAEAADRAKSEFLANMSHEIRTPMNGVLGMAELLAKSNLDTRQKTFVDIVVKSGNALLTIINDILDFSKIDAGQMKLRQAPFDPVEAIEDVATLLSSSAAEKDIELIVRGDASVRDTVMGDAGRFRQIVTNLVGNAVKFTEKGHVFIDLHSEPDGPGGVMLTIRIEDTGLGIPDDKLQSVFEKFSQVDSSSTRRHEGTGLGLAITAGLVDLFGGRIAVESEVGRGSVFTVRLPFDVVSERSSTTVLPVNTNGARILVIDDNPVNRRILTEQLTMWGFDTFAVEGGADGLAILDEAAKLGFTIDAIVLDYHMPEMNGMEVAGRLRRDRRFDSVGIVFLTSMDMAGDDSAFAALNIQAHLMKPARANLLRSTIIDVVRSVRTKRRIEAPSVVAAAHPAAVVSQPAPLPVEMPSTPPVASVSTLDVLVAEDNDVNQIVFTQILQATGWRFEIVKNGAEAVDTWQSRDPAVIIMDVSMPVMNGHQATQRIRELERQTGTHVPIIGVTAHALESDRELCFQVGMDDYLSKPISPEALETKIRNWIGSAPAASISG